MNLSHALDNYEFSVDQAVPTPSELELHNLTSIAVRPNDWVELIELELLDAPNVNAHEISDYKEFLSLAMTPLAKQEMKAAFGDLLQTNLEENLTSKNRAVAAMGFALGEIEGADIERIRQGDLASLQELSESSLSKTNKMTDEVDKVHEAEVDLTAPTVSYKM